MQDANEQDKLVPGLFAVGEIVRIGPQRESVRWQFVTPDLIVLAAQPTLIWHKLTEKYSTC